MLTGTLVELGELRPERGEPRRELVGAQAGGPYGIQRGTGAEQRVPGALDGGGEPGELRLGGVEERPQILLEAVEFALHTDEFVLGGGQFGPRPRGDGGVEVVPVQVVGVDCVDVLVGDLVDAAPEGREVVDGSAGAGRTVHGRDRLDGDPQVALGGVEFVEGGRRGVLGRLGIGAQALAAPAEPTARPASGEGAGQHRGAEHHGERDEHQHVPDGGTRSAVRPRVCRRHIPLPCCVALLVHSPTR